MTALSILNHISMPQLGVKVSAAPGVHAIAGPCTQTSFFSVALPYHRHMRQNRCSINRTPPYSRGVSFRVTAVGGGENGVANSGDAPSTDVTVESGKGETAATADLFHVVTSADSRFDIDYLGESTMGDMKVQRAYFDSLGQSLQTLAESILPIPSRFRYGPQHRGASCQTDLYSLSLSLSWSH